MPCTMRRNMWMAPTRNSPGMVYKPGEARDLPVLLHGNVATPGEIVPRHFLAVLAKGDGTVQERIGPAGAGGEESSPMRRRWPRA